MITAPMRERASAAVALMVGAGSRHEARTEAGLAHFIEHMVFKGTDRYPSARRLSEAIEGVGGALNAATDKEMTMFWAKVPAQHLALAVEVLAEMVFRSVFDPGEVEKERLVVIEELRMYQDNPQDHVATLFDEVMWPDHPLGWDTAGTEETVRSLGRDDCRRFLEAHYRGDRVVAAVAGGVDAGPASRLLAEAIDGRVAPGVAPEALPARPLAAEAERLRLVQRRTEQANVCLGARSLSYNHPDRFVVDLLTTVLGEGMSSRLFLHLREERGLAYDVHSFTVKHRDSGALGIYIGCDPRRAAAAIEAAVAELVELAEAPVGDVELRKARMQTEGRLLLQLESTSSLCTYLGQQELLTDEILLPAQVIEALEAVTAEDIRRVARETLEGGLRAALIGPFRSEQKFLKILART